MKPNLLVISSFPPKGETHHNKTVGVASYTKNLLKNIYAEKTVLAEELDKDKSYAESHIKVKRIWKRNSPFTFLKLLVEVKKAKENEILFEFEHAMFGDTLSLLPLPFFLFIVRQILGKKIFFVFHQVVGNIDSLSGHLNIKKGSFKSFLYGFLMYFFYKSILFNVTKAIVFEEKLKERLGNSPKIIVIPHIIEEFPAKESYFESRKRLNLPKDKIIILCFGFLAWYKGSDLIVELFKGLPRNIRTKFFLVLAGGPNPNHLKKSYYLRYINSLKRNTQKDINVTGFVPEKDIAPYFKASDLVLFPYRTFISASGPLSFALSLSKPFMISKALKEILETKDFANAVSESNLSEEELIFSLNRKGLLKALKFSQNKAWKKNFSNLSALIKAKRDFKMISLQYEELIFQAQADEKLEPIGAFEGELA